jgi:hypothetical protein
LITMLIDQGEDSGGQHWRLIARTAAAYGNCGVINYCHKLRAQRGNSEKIEVDIRDADVTYVLDVYARLCR